MYLTYVIVDCVRQPPSFISLFLCRSKTRLSAVSCQDSFYQMHSKVSYTTNRVKKMGGHTDFTVTERNKEDRETDELRDVAY